MMRPIHAALVLLAALVLWLVSLFIDPVWADEWWEHTLVLASILLPAWLPALVVGGIVWRKRALYRRRMKRLFYRRRVMRLSKASVSGP